ncbi:hypothetical protein ACSBR1_003496 [Camellia fascicularis]
MHSSALRDFCSSIYRIIRCGGAVDDDMANIIVAQLLYLETRFLVFEDIENGTLKAHLNDRLQTPLNWRTRLQIVIGVAAALIHVLYKGTLRVLLVLLHDFPEFLCDYHFSFCDVIPSSCIQMRNVILSAFYLDCIFFIKEFFLSCNNSHMAPILRLKWNV